MLVLLEKGEFPTGQRAVISHAIRRSGRHPLVTTTFADSVLANSRLPSASELLDNLLLYVSGELGAPGEVMNLRAATLRAVLGALSSKGVRWAIEQAMELGFLQGKAVPSVGADDNYQVIRATLSVSGWARVEALLREAKDSRKAFMAMKFGDPELDAVFKDHFKLAVQQTGFNLQRLDEEPRAGLIDDRMRLEIRTSRFLIADLTHSNAGAYWEAGYAEGLGRPVIYTCRKDVFDDEKKRPHFDTNHHLTVIWDPAALDEAMVQLKTVIRVTLPSEAILEDDLHDKS
jgi:nucleoside 2-deoxyribosyltransferase